jgi:hypothetical protein
MRGSGESVKEVWVRRSTRQQRPRVLVDDDMVVADDTVVEDDIESKPAAEADAGRHPVGQTPRSATATSVATKQRKGMSPAVKKRVRSTEVTWKAGHATGLSSQSPSSCSSLNWVAPGRQLETELRLATASLALLHPHVVLSNAEQRSKTLLESDSTRRCVTDSIVATMLSQNTTDKNSKGKLARSFTCPSSDRQLYL